MTQTLRIFPVEQLKIDTSGEIWDPSKIIIVLRAEKTSKPNLCYETLAEAKQRLHPNLPVFEKLEPLPATGAPRLVVHIKHGPQLDLSDLGFLKLITDMGFDVDLGILPKGSRST
jgi:hypothetical protein